MLKQGDIIKIKAQNEYKSALIISNDIFNTQTKLAIICPIMNTDSEFPLHINLDKRTKTTGVILCEHVKTLDLNTRVNRFVEKLPDDILERVIDVIFAETEIIN